jgi:preprotein translocase subunit SecA
MISIYDRYEAVEDVLQVRDLYDPRTQWASFVVNGLKVRTIRGR